MSRQDSVMLKGLAIMMMLFLHLFNQMSNCKLCVNYINISDIPLVNFLSRAANPVDFFLFLSGFGLFLSNKSCEWDIKKNMKKNIKRLSKLYIHFWFILTIFVILGCILRPSKYPGSFMELIGNYSSFIYTYNGEYWFLFPYAILAILSPIIFKVFIRFHYIVPVILTLFVNIFTSFIISRYGALFIYNTPYLYNPILIFHLLFPFTLGMTCARTNFWGLLGNLSNVKGVFLWLSFAILVILYCFFPNYATHIIYVLLLIVVFVSAPKSKIIKKIFIKLGENSMNMWFIHTWLCYYLFKKFIYGFKYPILVYLILIILSLFISLSVNLVLKPVENKLLK